MAKSKVIYLHDVPIYTQGSMDMACGYYCALMFLTAMSQEFGKRFWGPGGSARLLPFSARLYGPDAAGITVRENSQTGRPGLFPTVESVLAKCGLGGVTSQSKSSVWAAVVDAIRKEQPSILRLPNSAHHPDGHYVVVKGYVPSAARGTRGERLLVNDPSTGEREIREAALNKERKDPASALIATQPTWLRVLARANSPR